MFDKVEAYLNKNNIELTDEDYTPDGRFVVSEDSIIKWNFPIPKPTKEDLELEEDKEDKEKRNDKKEFKNKIKTLRQQQITILKKKEFDKMKQENLFEEGDVFICQNKLYIITNIKPLQSFPNII